jgi:hypothetical protein
MHSWDALRARGSYEVYRSYDELFCLYGKVNPGQPFGDTNNSRV